MNLKKPKKNVFLLGITSFINDTASDMILPILPLFISQLGGGGLAVGLIAGLGESVAAIFKMLSGYYSDKISKRKPFVLSGYFIASIAKILFSVAQVWPHVLLLKILERFGKGLRTAPRDAILAASTTRENRGRGFGFHRMMDSGGAVLGSILALILFWFYGFDFRTIFLVAGVISFFSLAPLIFVKDKKKELAEKKNFDLKIGFNSLSPILKFFIVIAMLFSFGNFSYMFFVLKSQSFFASDLAIGIPLFLYILYNISYTLFAYPVGIISDKIGRKQVLLAGYFLFGLVCFGFIYSGSFLFFAVLFILFGLNYAIVNATERAFVSDIAEEETRATALGTFHMAVSISALPGGLVAGLLWDINPVYPFIFGLSVSIVVVILFLMLFKKKHVVLDKKKQKEN